MPIGRLLLLESVPNPAHVQDVAGIAEIWEPKRGHIWMKRWLETHRMRKAARQALECIRTQHRRYRQLAFDFNFDT